MSGAVAVAVAGDGSGVDVQLLASTASELLGNPRALGLVRQQIDELGACAVAGPSDDIYFPARVPSCDPARRRAAEREAATACEGCAVLHECLVWAVATRQHFGVWGGRAPHEVDRLIRVVSRLSGAWSSR